MKNPRILMVIPRFLPVVGGTEKQCWLLSKELARRGFRISVLTEREKGTPYFEELEGVKIYRLPGLKLPFFPSFGFFKTGSLFLLLNGFKYGLIHLHLVTSFPRSVYGYLAHYAMVLLGYQVLKLANLI